MSTISEPKVIPTRPPKPHKIEQVEELTRLLDASKGTFLTDYRGLTVAEITDLRRRLQQNGAEYHVVKNTLFRIAAGDRAAALDEHLHGPVAVAFALEDPAAPAKTILDFIREKRKAEVKVGLLDGKIYDPEGIRLISLLPSRQVLLGEVVGAIQSPLYGIVGTFQSIISQFVFTLQAIEDQKSGSAS